MQIFMSIAGPRHRPLNFGQKNTLYFYLLRAQISILFFWVDIKNVSSRAALYSKFASTLDACSQNQTNYSQNIAKL